MSVAGLETAAQTVPFLVFVLTAHAQGQRGDLFEIALFGQEDGDRIVRNRLVIVRLGQFVGIDDRAAARGRKLAVDFRQLVNQHGAQLAAAVQDALQRGDVLLQGFDLRGAAQNVFPVDVAQADFGDKLGLRLVNAEADHQIRYDIAFEFGIADNLDRAVNIQQNLLQALQKVQFVLLPCQFMENPAPDAFRTPCNPFLQNLLHAHDTGISGNEDVEVAGEGILQGRRTKELLHQLFRIRTALEVNREAQAVQVRLVAHVIDLADLPRLDQLGHLVQDGLAGRRIGNLGDLDQILLLQIAPAGTDGNTPPPGTVDRLHSGTVIENLAAGRKIRGRHQTQQIRLAVAQQGDGCRADLIQVEAADLTCHADRNAGVGGDQHIGKGRRQQDRLLHAAVIVVDKVNGILVDVVEYRCTDLCELGLGITGGGIGHVTGIDLAEVPFGVHEGRQKGLVARGQADHGLIDGSIPVGIEPHGLADDVGTLGARTAEQTHLVHGIEELAMRGLEAVDLGDRTGDDDAHGIGHVVLLERIGNRLLAGLAAKAEDIRIISVFRGFFCLFLSHGLPQLKSA